MNALPIISQDELELIRLAYSRSLTMLQARQLLRDYGAWILTDLRPVR